MKAVHELYAREVDFQPVSKRATRRYLIAASPRSGSTFLSVLLWNTSVLGAPLEYLNPYLVGGLEQRLGAPLGSLSYWHQLCRIRTSPNGVFGHKVFRTDLLRLRSQNAPLLGAIEPTHVVYLTRRDHMAQAVSYSRALRSDDWFGQARDPRMPDFDRNHINQCLQVMQRDSEFWETLFQSTGVPVLRLEYEKMIESPVSLPTQVSTFLGVAEPPGDLGLPLPSRMPVAHSSERDSHIKTTSEPVATRRLDHGVLIDPSETGR